MSALTTESLNEKNYETVRKAVSDIYRWLYDRPNFKDPKAKLYYSILYHFDTHEIIKSGSSDESKLLVEEAGDIGGLIPVFVINSDVDIYKANRAPQYNHGLEKDLQYRKAPHGTIIGEWEDHLVYAVDTNTRADRDLEPRIKNCNRLNMQTQLEEFNYTPSMEYYLVPKQRWADLSMSNNHNLNLDAKFTLERIQALTNNPTPLVYRANFTEWLDAHPTYDPDYDNRVKEFRRR